MTTRFTLNVSKDEMDPQSGHGVVQNATMTTDNADELMAALRQLAGLNTAANNYGAQAVVATDGDCGCDESVEEDYANSPDEETYDAPGGVGDLVDTGHDASVKNRYTKAGYGDNPLAEEDGDAASILAKCASGDVDIYDIYSNPKTPAEQEASKVINDMYQDVAVDHHLHPDDDFEKILDIVADHLGEEYGVAEAHTRAQAADKFHKYNDDELEVMVRRARGNAQPGDAHKQKRFGQAKRAASKIAYSTNEGNEDLEESLAAMLMNEWKETKLQGISEEFDTDAALTAIVEGKKEYLSGSKKFAIRLDETVAKVYPIMENRALMTMPLFVIDTASLVKEASEELEEAPGDFTVKTVDPKDLWKKHTEPKKANMDVPKDPKTGKTLFQKMTGEDVNEDWGSSDGYVLVKAIDDAIAKHGLSPMVVQDEAENLASFYYDSMGYDSPEDAIPAIIDTWKRRSETGRKLMQMFAPVREAKKKDHEGKEEAAPKEVVAKANEIAKDMKEDVVAEGTMAHGIFDRDGEKAQHAIDKLESMEMLIADGAGDKLYDLVFDDELFDIIDAVAEENPSANLMQNKAFKKRLSHLLKWAKDEATAEGQTQEGMNIEMEDLNDILALAGMHEAKKPDFLDADGDGDKEEPMTKALKDKEEKVDEAKPDFLDLDKDGDKEEPMAKAAKDKVEEATCSVCNEDPCCCEDKKMDESADADFEYMKSLLAKWR